MKKTNITLISSVFTVILLVLIGLGYFVSESKIQMLLNNDFQSKVNKARFINKNIDIVLLMQNDYYNFDNINQKLKRLESYVTELEAHKAYSLVVRKKELDLLLTKIKFSLEEKKKIVQKFKSYNAIFQNSHRYLSTLHAKLLQNLENQDFENRLLILKIYNSIMRFQFKDDQKILDIENKIFQLQSDINKFGKNKVTVSNFILHSKTLLKYNSKLNIILKENSALSIDYQLEKFLLTTSKHFDKIVEDFAATTISLMIALFLFMIVIIYLYIKQLLSKRELMRFTEAVQSSDNSIMITESDFTVSYVNDSFMANTGYTKEEVIGATPKILSSGLHSKEFYNQLTSQIRQGKKWSGEFINRKKDGSFVYEKTTITPLLNEKGKVENYIGIKLDVTKEKEHIQEIENKNKEISFRYYNDPITKLPNYNRLIENLNENSIGTFILVNVDRFDEIKFFYGLDFTANFLIQFAELLDEIAKEKMFFSLYKLEKDEFAFWIDDLDVLNKLNELLVEIHGRIVGKRFFIDGHTINVTATLGCSYFYFGENLSVNDLLIQGDLAHRHAKRHKLPYAVFDTKQLMNDLYKDNLVWTGIIKQAIGNDNIVTYYQPIVDRDKKIVAYETLMRLKDEEGTIISPFKFLEISKKSSLYSQLTKIVIEKSFEQFSSLDTRFSINLDFEDINNNEIKKLLISKLEEFHTPSNLTIEVLESSSIENYEDVTKFIREIKKYGCRVAIDDFGSGFSNYERVVKLDVDYLKIDGSIIKNILTDKSMDKVAKSIIFFGKSIGVKIVAEFVSNEEIFEYCKDLGVDLFQGFYFSEPKDIPPQI
ncbi:MAG: EAL domain-containing protein [Campylobacterales bacterium]|nr:EAL domain-containing protein [Campylobacterales bacterium]